MPLPRPLPQNANLAFRGEPAWPEARLTAKQAQAVTAAGNRCGRPNADVLRRRLAVVDGEPRESWQIDFPAHFTEQEAALYEKPFAQLAPAGTGWQNPHANPDLRRALARVSRFLAMPADAEIPDWRWIEDDLLPDATLLVVARDDDFTHGILQSGAFAAWHGAFRHQLAPVDLVASFPFPWPPATTLSALSSSQEEKRHAVARAVRRGDKDALDRAVAEAYGWPGELDAAAQLDRLIRQQL